MAALTEKERALAAVTRGRQDDGTDWGPEGAPTLAFAPVVDGDVLPDRIDLRLAAGAARHGFPDQALLMRLAEWWQALLASLGETAA